MSNGDSGIDPTTLAPLRLPPGLKSRYVDTSPISLKFHILESVPDLTGSNKYPPLILCVHGFPNLAFDWRFILPKLAEAGFHAVAFDQRGYGRTHNADLSPINDDTFHPLTLVKDIVALVHALGHTSIHTLVGHDFGASASSMCAITRPDFVRSLVLMSHPYNGTFELPYATAVADGLPPPPALTTTNPYNKLKDPSIHQSLLQLSPPRKHYKWYYCTPPASDDMTYPTGQSLHEFLRGYFHLKSADWPSNDPRPLESWTASALEQMPHYYIMLANGTMRDNVAHDMMKESPDVIAKLPTTSWLPDSDLAVYASEYARTTFRQPLLWYHLATSSAIAADLHFLAGARLSMPTKFVTGIKDWGNFQEPGAIQQMEEGRSVAKNCYRGTVFVQGSGHWVNQEKPGDCVKEILDLARSV